MELKLITISLSKANSDVANLLIEKKENKRFKQGEYICKCIRFYEKYKDKIIETIKVSNSQDHQQVNEKILRNIINSEIDKKLSVKYYWFSYSITMLKPQYKNYECTVSNKHPFSWINEMNKKHEGNSSFVLLNYKEISLEEYNIAKKQI